LVAQGGQQHGDVSNTNGRESVRWPFVHTLTDLWEVLDDDEDICLTGTDGWIDKKTLRHVGFRLLPTIVAVSQMLASIHDIATSWDVAVTCVNSSLHSPFESLYLYFTQNEYYDIEFSHYL
jgi:hypothetical protein